MNFNPYGLPIPQKSPQQMQSEYNALMSQYQAMYNGNPMNNQQSQSVSTSSVSERGEFVKVSGFDEVQEAPTRLDGTATLFFDFKNRVFWSKKFSGGAHSIQAFKFEPVNNPEPLVREEDEDIDYTKLLEGVPDPTEERLNKIESMLEQLLISPKKQRAVKEEAKDEI